MTKNWFAWGLSALLLISVLVGLVVERPRSTRADTVGEERRDEKRDELPRFDCEDRAKAPYNMTDEDREGHVAWFETKFSLSPEQVKSMDEVYVDVGERAGEFWRQAKDSYCELRTEFYADIRSVLTPEQIVALDQHLDEKRLRRAQKEAKEAEGDGSEADVRTGTGKRP